MRFESFLAKKWAEVRFACWRLWHGPVPSQEPMPGPCGCSPPLDIFGLGVAHNWQVGSLLQPFEERLCGLKRLALRNGFAQAAPEEWLTPVLHMIQTEPQFWRYGKFSGVQSWRLFRFVQGFGIHTDPGIGSLREPARAIAPGKKAEPPPIFFVKKDLHPRKKTQAPEGNSSDACLLLQTINSSEPSVQSLGISAHNHSPERSAVSTLR